MKDNVDFGEDSSDLDFGDPEPSGLRTNPHLEETRDDDLDFGDPGEGDTTGEPGEDWTSLYESLEAPRPESIPGLPQPMAGPEYGPGPEHHEPEMAREKLNLIAGESQACRDCPLGARRKNAVPGIGPAGSSVLFIGEAPGQNEDETGHPFTGQAGKLLDGLLARAGTNRNRVFITNMLKCRPPDNRDPTPGELEACGHYLDRQVDAIKPRLIVTLGRFSTEKFIPGVELKTLRSNVYRLEDGTLVMPVYHPAAALRRKEWRKELIQDFGTIGEIMDGREPEANEKPEPKQRNTARRPQEGDENTTGRSQAPLF